MMSRICLLTFLVSLVFSTSFFVTQEFGGATSANAQATPCNPSVQRC
jgi:hypothetical protein